MKLRNSKGSVYYGLHMYPGLAEYVRDGNPYRVLLNENTIKKMDTTFSGRPVYVQHVDGVEDDLDLLKNEADGWVTRSFYNPADGKHWVEFIAVTSAAERAIKMGWKLSNCIAPDQFGPGGTYNGMSYDKEVLGGEYEHLAIVADPRYEESVILTPDQFKKYNNDKLEEIKRLSNQKEKRPMKFQMFKREKMKNSADLEDLCVVLPKSGKEYTIEKLVNAMDEVETAGPKTYKVGDKDLTADQLLDKYTKLAAEMAELKASLEEVEEEIEEEVDELDDDIEDLEDDEELENSADDDEDLENSSDDEEELENAAEEKIKEVKKKEDPKKDLKNKAKLKAKAKMKNERDLADKKKAAREKADRLRFANDKGNQMSEMASVEIMGDQVARGKSRYGS